jgi:hypothetical protein
MKWFFENTSLLLCFEVSLSVLVASYYWATLQTKLQFIAYPSYFQSSVKLVATSACRLRPANGHDLHDQNATGRNWALTHRKTPNPEYPTPSVSMYLEIKSNIAKRKGYKQI